jgi:surface protein
MSNRNFDASTIIKILKAQNAAANHNRFQTLTNSGVNQLAPNPQTEHFDADVVNEYNAGTQAYYLQGVPTMTVISPIVYPSLIPTTAGATPVGPVPDAPILTSVTPGDTQLAVSYLASVATIPPITNYLYSTDGGTTFTAFSPETTANPLIITGLTNGQTYSVVLQAVSSNGTSASSNSLTGTPSSPFIYSFVYSGAPIDVLTRIPVITTGGGTLTISSSFTQVGTTYTITVSLISFTDNGSTTKGISFNSSVAVNNFYKVIPVTIQQFGSIPLSRGGSVFINLAQLTISPTTIPVILPTTSFDNLFFGCTNFNSDISGWNTAAVTDMSYMFTSATAFNQPIGTWNTAAVKYMNRMFNGATAFNNGNVSSGLSAIGSWNTASVEFMNSMFESATAFNQPIGTWNTAKVTVMDSMFRAASRFNQPIGDWNTTLVTNMQAMFNLASAFNRNISYQAVGSKWNTAAVKNMAVMFSGATVFNNGEAALGTTARLDWLTTGVTLPVASFRASSALTVDNSKNSAGVSIG